MFGGRNALMGVRRSPEDEEDLGASNDDMGSVASDDGYQDGHDNVEVEMLSQDGVAVETEGDEGRSADAENREETAETVDGPPQTRRAFVTPAKDDTEEVEEIQGGSWLKSRLKKHGSTVHSETSSPARRDSSQLQLQVRTTEETEDDVRDALILSTVDTWEYGKLLVLFALLYAVPAFQSLTLLDTAQCSHSSGCNVVLLGLQEANTLFLVPLPVLYGVAFLVWVHRSSQIDDLMYGLSKPEGLHISLAACMILQGLMPLLWHVCPTDINAQFDLSFVNLTLALLGCVLYSRRRPEKLVSTTKLLGVFVAYVLIAYLDTVWRERTWYSVALYALEIAFIEGLTIGATFWFYTGRLSCLRPSEQWNEMVRVHRRRANKTGSSSVPLGIVMNLVSLASVVFLLVMSVSFGTAVLSLLVLQFSVFVVHYVVQKRVHGERVTWSAWLLFILGLLVWLTAAGVYGISSVLTPDSASLPTGCVLLGFFTWHSLWHVGTGIAVALFASFVWIVDDDLETTPRNRIAVF